MRNAATAEFLYAPDGSFYFLEVNALPSLEQGASLYRCGALIGLDRVAKVLQASEEDYEQIVKDAQTAFVDWRMVPAPKRGEVVRQLGEEMRKYKRQLGQLVAWEMGKILSEGEGEVQEAIDIADFAVGKILTWIHNAFFTTCW